MSLMKDSHVGWAQIALTFAFIGMYFAVLCGFMLGHVKVPADFRDAFVTLLGVITGSVGTVISYWFSRQRPETPKATGG